MGLAIEPICFGGGSYTFEILESAFIAFRMTRSHS